MMPQYPPNDAGRRTPCLYILLKVLDPIWTCGGFDVRNHAHSSPCLDGRRGWLLTPDVPRTHAPYNGRMKGLQVRYFRRGHPRVDV